MNINELQALVARETALPLTQTSPFVLHSRCHRVRSMQAETWVKRDDELSLGASGYKYRKLASLAPYLFSREFKHVALVGSGLSNFVVSASQLFLELGIQPTLFVREQHGNVEHPQANLRDLLIPPKHVVVVARDRWTNIEQLAAEEMRRRYKAESFCFLPEGGFHPAGVMGCVSLATDIIANEAELGFRFDKIVVDAGTAFTALALIFGFSLLKEHRDLTIVPMADKWTQAEFTEKANAFFQWAAGFLNVEPPTLTVRLRVEAPSATGSFGAFSTAVAQQIVHSAREDGLLIDPIYNAKLFLTLTKLQEQHTAGRWLVVHSGGALSLFGFWNKLKKSMGASVPEA
ncbi:MAG: pyridoxal-phosphate dependent enzyme [Oligoflexales bacterium]